MEHIDPSPDKFVSGLVAFISAAWKDQIYIMKPGAYIHYTVILTVIHCLKR